jgi:hypothetical protein
MSEPNKGTDQKAGTKKRTTSSRTRTAAGKATAQADRAARPVADKASDGASAVAAGAGNAARRTSAVAGAAARKAEAGRRAASAATGQVTVAARTAWTALAHRKLLAAGVGAGMTVLSAASYAVGRRSGRSVRGPQGPITRLTGGRI